MKYKYRVLVRSIGGAGSFRHWDQYHPLLESYRGGGGNEPGKKTAPERARLGRDCATRGRLPGRSRASANICGSAHIFLSHQGRTYHNARALVELTNSALCLVACMCAATRKWFKSLQFSRKLLRQELKVPSSLLPALLPLFCLGHVVPFSFVFLSPFYHITG